MADPESDSLFREIDEDIRHEKYAKLWKKYGVYVIIAAVLMVGGVAGYQGWRAYDLNARQSASDRLIAANELIDADPAAAERILLGLAEDGPAGYALLAKFRSAALIGERGERDLAAAAYWALAEQDIDPMYRHLAVVLGAQQMLAQPTAGSTPDELLARLEPLTAPNNPWRFSARELQAIIALRSGDKERGRELLGGLAEDAGAPAGVRALATELLAAIDQS